MAVSDDTGRHWHEAQAEISRFKGLAFKATCLGATVLALGFVFVLLLYVANNAVQPATADAGWLLTFVGTIGVPAGVLAVYYYRFDSRAGEVAFTATGLPIVATLAAGGAIITVRHIITPHEWFALVVAAGIAAGIVALHARIRDAAALERTAVVVGVPLLALVGIPGVAVDRTISTPVLGQELFALSASVPALVPSLRETILALPMLPMAWMAFFLAFAIPVAAGVSARVRRVRESDRLGVVAGVASLGTSALGVALGFVFELPPTYGLVVTTVIGVPVGLYAEQVVRRGEGLVGLAFPITVAAGAALGGIVVSAAGFAGPDLWLDWSFLTERHSTTPRDAGIYPALVGSVMILVIVALAAFPIGVGAAVYLEEYAPTQGRLGSLVELIEINIANLAGVPSVVYGALGLAVFVRGVGLRSGIVLVGGLTIALLILPIVIVSAQEAIRGVPDSLRQASAGMGATRWQTVRTVVVPQAMPGILTGTILALGRAIGETAPLLMIGVAAVVRVPPDSFVSLSSAMPRQIYSWSTLIDHDFRFGVLAAGVVTLLVVLLTMNASAIVLRNRFHRNE